MADGSGRLRFFGLVAAVAVVVGLGSFGGSPAGAAADVTVTVGPRWGEVPTGSWTPYSVTVRNGGGVDIRGEVVLTAQPEPPPKPGAMPTQTAAASTPSTVVSIGGRAVTAPLPKGRGTSATPPWPTYRAPVSVPPGSEKTVTVMVLQSAFGFGVELVGGGDVLARGTGPVPVGEDRVAVLLLSDVAGADARIEALPQMVGPGVDVIQLRAARDFPDVALHLAGLNGVILDDFATASLSDRQLRALQDYVSLGGSLVVTGGAAWSRTLGSLPPALAPLRASASEPASLGPLADLVGGATTATTEVATGEVTAGRVVLGGPGGPPLVVESDHRGGRVIQLTYDPLAEPIATDDAIEGVAWDQALARVANRWGELVFSRQDPAKVAEDQLWASALGAQPWPSWPRWGAGLILIHALVVGPAIFLLSRRGRSRLGWAVVPLAVVLTAGSGLLVARTRTTGSEAVVEVQTLGSDGTVMATAHRGVLDLDPGAVEVPGAATTVFSGRPVFRPLRGDLDPLGPTGSVDRGVGGGAIRTGAEHPTAQLGAGPWELRTLQTLKVDRGGPALDATLRLVGESEGSPARVQGTVTNRGSAPVRRLRAQVQEGQARLADVLDPGETESFDAPLARVSSGDPRPGQQAGPPEEVAMFAAASRSFTGPGQIAVVGVPDAAKAGATADTKPAGRHVSVVVAAVPLVGAETVLAGSGGPRVVTAARDSDGLNVVVSDIDSRPGPGPLSVRYLTELMPSLGRTPDPSPLTAEVYSWTTGTWRTLPSPKRPPRDQPQFPYIDAPLDPAEVNNGLVRFRSRGKLGITASNQGAELLLTSTSISQAPLLGDGLNGPRYLKMMADIEAAQLKAKADFEAAIRGQAPVTTAAP